MIAYRKREKASGKYGNSRKNCKFEIRPHKVRLSLAGLHKHSDRYLSYRLIKTGLSDIKGSQNTFQESSKPNHFFLLNFD